MVFSENPWHFPEPALADVGAWREAGAGAATARFLAKRQGRVCVLWDNAHLRRAGLRLTNAAADACYLSQFSGAFANEQN
jgi:hypothetical protein